MVTSTLKHKLNCIHSLRRFKKFQLLTLKKLTNAEVSLQKEMAEAKITFECTSVDNFATTNNNRLYKYISSITKSNMLPSTNMHLIVLVNPLILFSVCTNSCPPDFSINALSLQQHQFYASRHL